MTAAFVQAVLTALAYYGLWRLWSTLSNRGAASKIIAIGLLLRALLGQVLFWISWLELPIARSLQVGDGLWFFGSDGRDYFRYVNELIARGPKAIALANAVYPSHAFVQLLTLAALAFGAVTSIAILLNCAAYLATCTAIETIGRRMPPTPRLVALTAIAFGPATILWSLQPLKDTFFLFAIAALTASFFQWQELWREDVRPLRRIGCAVAMLVLVYAIAGTRWYFAAIAWAMSAPFFALAAASAMKKRRAAIGGIVMFLLLSQAFRLGGADDVPRSVRRLIDPRITLGGAARSQAARAPMNRYLPQLRTGFEQTPAATMIAPGTAFASKQAST